MDNDSSESTVPTGVEDDGRARYCSFCGKNQDEVQKLIAGPEVFICDECVSRCQAIVDETEFKDPAENVTIRPLSERVTKLRDSIFQKYARMSEKTIELGFWTILGTILILQIVAIVLLISMDS